MLQVCLNGTRLRDQHPRVPLTPEALAQAARTSVAAGAEDIHLHPKDSQGRDTLDADVVAETLTRVRAAVPGVPVGVTTGAWISADPSARADLVRSWTVLPDHASVNWHETGADLVARTLLDRGVAVEAGIFSGTGAAARFNASPLATHVLRVLAEVTDPSALTAPRTAASLLHELDRSSSAPVLLHGEDAGAWPVLRLAASLGLDSRIGLEDVLYTPDGAPAIDNTSLVTAAVLVRNRTRMEPSAHPDLSDALDPRRINAAKHK